MQNANKYLITFVGLTLRQEKLSFRPLKFKREFSLLSVGRWHALNKGCSAEVIIMRGYEPCHWHDVIITTIIVIFSVIVFVIGTPASITSSVEHRAVLLPANPTGASRSVSAAAPKNPSIESYIQPTVHKEKRAPPAPSSSAVLHTVAEFTVTLNSVAVRIT